MTEIIQLCIAMSTQIVKLPCAATTAIVPSALHVRSARRRAIAARNVFASGGRHSRHQNGMIIFQASSSRLFSLLWQLSLSLSSAVSASLAGSSSLRVRRLRLS